MKPDLLASTVVTDPSVDPLISDRLRAVFDNAMLSCSPILITPPPNAYAYRIERIGPDGAVLEVHEGKLTL